MISVELSEVGKTFAGTGTEVLRGLSLKIHPGEIVAIRGDNGSGKTTLLNIIAGVYSATHGKVLIAGVNGGLEAPSVGYTQQDYTSSLLPWFNVTENIALPLRLHGQPRSKRQQRVLLLLNALGFDKLPQGAYPHQLSGGQRQRVALARALIHRPKLLLLDEPFSNLDYRTARELQAVLADIHLKWNPTILYTSHDIDQSIFLADRVMILHGSPASFAEKIDVSLSRPRGREILLSEEFAALRRRIVTVEEKLYEA